MTDDCRYSEVKFRATDLIYLEHVQNAYSENTVKKLLPDEFILVLHSLNKEYFILFNEFVTILDRL
jgi:hypothetical protein